MDPYAEQPSTNRTGLFYLYWELSYSQYKTEQILVLDSCVFLSTESSQHKNWFSQTVLKADSTRVNLYLNRFAVDRGLHVLFELVENKPGRCTDLLNMAGEAGENVGYYAVRYQQP